MNRRKNREDCRAYSASVTTLLRATPSGQWKLFEMLFNQAFPPAQPDLFMTEEIERLRLANHSQKKEATN
jgi:hypothetical protein